MNARKNIVPLITGFAAVAAVGAVLYAAPAFGARHVVTGIAAGIGVAYLGLLCYYLLMPRPDGTMAFFLKSYLPGAVARYAVIIGAFCAVLFWLKIEPLGVLLGAFAGMMAATFITLLKMRRTATRAPET